MKAWVLDRYGEPEDVVLLGDIEAPTAVLAKIGRGEVRGKAVITCDGASI